jgi:hypothetical protein
MTSHLRERSYELCNDISMNCNKPESIFVKFVFLEKEDFKNCYFEDFEGDGNFEDLILITTYFKTVNFHFHF